MIDVDTLKGQSVGELIKLAKKLQEELFAAKFQHATQQLKTPHKLRELRRDIARVKTFTTKKRLEVAGKAPAAAKVKAAAAPKTEKAEKPAKKAASNKKEK
jgi:large subunit ribosomal protein L29